MAGGPPAASRGRRPLVFAVGAALLLAVIVAAGLWLAGRQGPAEPAPTPTPTPTEAAEQPSVPVLTRAVALRSAASAESAIITRLRAGTELRVLGRAPDSRWLVASPASAADLIGWVPVDAVDGLPDIERLAVVADARSLATPPPSRPTGPIDLPDLRVEEVTAMQNHLLAVIVNDGPGDLRTPIFVSVDGGEPVFIDTKSGEALRAHDRFEAVVPDAYVQIRGPVTVRVLTRPEDGEASLANNTWSGIVEPDLPNDLALEGVAAGDAEGEVIVSVRNASRIPVAGEVELTVSESPPGQAVLATVTRSVMLEAGETIDLAVAGLPPVALTHISVALATSAIDDAVPENNVYPR